MAFLVPSSWRRCFGKSGPFFQNSTKIKALFRCFYPIFAVDFRFFLVYTGINSSKKGLRSPLTRLLAGFICHWAGK